MIIICYQQSNYRIFIIFNDCRSDFLEWGVGQDICDDYDWHYIVFFILFTLISSISSLRVGRATGTSWLGSLCFVTHPNQRFWCLAMLKTQFSLIKKRLNVQNTRYPTCATSINNYPTPLKLDVIYVLSLMQKIIRHTEQQTLLIKSFNP